MPEKKKFEEKPNTGAIFKNDKKTEDKHPNMKGSLKVCCPQCESEIELWVSAYTKEIKNGNRSGQKMQSLAVQPKEQQPEPSKKVLAWKKAGFAKAGPAPAPQENRRPAPPPAPYDDGSDDDDVPF